MAVDIIKSAEPSEAEREAILQPLIAYNQANGTSSRYEAVALMLRDGGGNNLGGLWGRLYYDWLFVELLFVPEALRGQDFGTRLLTMAEDIARQNDCVGIWLDTFSFQAPGFYRKLGYDAFGTLPDYPRGRARFFLRKLLSETTSAAADTSEQSGSTT